ncbi:MAG: ATP-binding protein [Polyangiales bacterium]
MDSTVRSIAFVGDAAQTFEVTATPSTAWTLTFESVPSTKEHPRDREARVILRSALGHWRIGEQPVTVRASGLSPAMMALPLDGAALHASLIALGKVPAESAATTIVFAASSLNGELRLARGAYAAIAAARELGIKRVVVAPGSRIEGRLALHDGALCEVIVAHDVGDLIDALNGRVKEELCERDFKVEHADFGDLRLPPVLVRALMVALAGGHNVAMTANPGCGATILARRLVGLLPYTDASKRSARSVASIAGLIVGEPVPVAAPFTAPFRAPHYTVSDIAMRGGGWPARPGEVSLARGGLLLLEEVDQFSRMALESTWGAVREGCTTHMRDGVTAKFGSRPAMVVATGSSCGCRTTKCTCSNEQRAQHAARMWKACGEHTDVQIELPPFRIGEAQWPSVPSAQLRPIIEAARARLAEQGGGAIPFDDSARKALDTQSRKSLAIGAASASIGLMARTIAALEKAWSVSLAHVEEAASYRCIERAAWSLNDGRIEVAS